MTKRQRRQTNYDMEDQSPMLATMPMKGKKSQKNNGKYTPQSDGTILFRGTKIGPFLGEWQGIPRNQIIASRLAEVSEADLKNTRIEPRSGGVRIYLGEVHFSLLAADIAAIGAENTQGESKAFAAALQTLKNMGAQPPKSSLAEQRGELAVRQAKLTYMKGKQQVGAGSWETRGRNSGPLLDEINAANYAGSGYEWCGMYLGHAYKKAGIRPEILRALVFWSGYRLHLFFTRGVNVNNRPIGSFWQPHQYKYLPLRGRTNRKKILEDFDPKPGDVVLFGASPYNHVAMVSSYNHETGVLELMEGNSGNRVQATAFGSNFGNISFIGRFNGSDYGGPAASSLRDAKTPNVLHTDKRSGLVS